MQTENKTVYTCDHCNKKLFRKHAMVKHEQYCTRNPDNFKKCSSCIFLKETKIEYTSFYFDGYGEAESLKKANGFQCSKLNKILYPLKVERLGLVGRYPETFADQEPMPKECQHFKF